VSNGKSLPKVLIAALHTAFFRPSLLDAKLVSIPSYTPTVVLPTQMEVVTTTQITEAMMPSRRKVITRIELPPEACFSIALTNKLRQLGDVARYAPRLVDGEPMRQSCDYSPPQPYFALL